MNIVEHVSLLHVGESFGYVPRSDIAGSSDNTMSNFLRNCQTDFQSGCASLQSHQQWRSVPLSPHPLQHLLSPEFFILAILTGVRWNRRVVLIRISLMTKDVEHFFRCFWTLWVSSVENSLFGSEHTWYALTDKWILGIPNGREALEKMFNILNHQGNANQNNPEIPPHTSQNG